MSAGSFGSMSFAAPNSLILPFAKTIMASNKYSTASSPDATNGLPVKQSAEPRIAVNLSVFFSLIRSCLFPTYHPRMCG